MAKKDMPTTFTRIACAIEGVVRSFIENGGTLWFCAPCCKKQGIVEEDLVANSTIVGGAKLVEALSQGAACVSC